MKVVLDTNIWISGLLLPNSKAGKVLIHWKAAQFQVVTSQFILDEIKKVLRYQKIKNRIRWNERKLEQYLVSLKFLTDFVPVEHGKANVVVPKDSNDTPILETLLVGQADYLVTGDLDLLSLKKEYPILTLAEFYDMN